MTTLIHPPMVSTSPSTTKHFNFRNSKLSSSFPFSFSRPSLPFPSLSHDVVSNSLNKSHSFFNSLRGSASVNDEEWDWDRWRSHFHEVDQQERLLRILKTLLRDAVRFEDYEDAATLKVAIAAVANNDTVGTVMAHLNRAIEEERYSDAAFLRDEAGTGLVGWWAGLSKDINDPRGLIIRITPEHGRYVARTYSPRQLVSSAAGVPLFEIFLTKNKKDEFKSQVVYLKQRTASFKALNAAEKLSLYKSPNDPEVVDDSSDASEGMPEFQNVLKDTIPGVNMKVLKVTTPDKVDEDIMSKVIEQTTEQEEDEHADEDADKDNNKENPEPKDIKSETDDEIELNSSLETFVREEQSKVAGKVIISGLVQELSSRLSMRDLRVPAKLETAGQGSFSFTIEHEVNQQVGHGKGKPSPDNSTKIGDQLSVDRVMSNVAKFIGGRKVPSKVLKDVGELISLSVSLAQTHEQLSGSTIFSRIEIPTSLDPLNGLYIGSHGLNSSEVIQLRCKYGNWQEDGESKKHSDLEFYQYVEALKLTGDPYIPAGQVAFRAKVGKRYQLPHEGIIPKELGLIARYKGQGRLADPKFQNPRWVDGELVILEGKYIRLFNLCTGPIIGFVYWAPDRPILAVFNRLILQQ
ncbi:hypothetical protein Fmac_009992 [Flemingia macrophylla]|uniref:Protein EXECUTER 1, chloroplastic n=1 Tax=Flemingia macrophylla TaxID=520843 RepID=A0ABD1N1U4_9FABA